MTMYMTKTWGFGVPCGPLQFSLVDFGIGPAACSNLGTSWRSSALSARIRPKTNAVGFSV
jgi:hypothetical protein